MAMVNFVKTHPEKYDKDFTTIVSYLGQMITKKGINMQSVCIPKSGSQLVKPKVATFTEKNKYMKYLREIWNFMSREQQWQVRQKQRYHTHP